MSVGSKGKRSSKRHSHHVELEVYKKRISTGGTSISPAHFIQLNEFFQKMALNQYHRTLHTINESLTEIKRTRDLEIKYKKPCSETEIFDWKDPDKEPSEENEEEATRCPNLKVIELLTESRAQDVYEGHFEGFDICSANHNFTIEENRKCVELMVTACDINIDHMLEIGIRCFIIDLFVGTEEENLLLVQRLKEAQVRVSKQLDFPVCTTLIAKLSPRHQYTGYLVPWESVLHLKARDLIMLTTDRYYSTRGNATCIYVNAHYLLHTLRVCDVLAIGNEVQVQVRRIQDENIFCVVTRGGELRSRTPVLFPQRCNRYLLSWEEIEGIAFAKEVGINVIISYIAGTPAYVEDLKIALSLLDCSNLRLFARIVLNEIKGCEYDLQWVLEQYDGFLLDTAPPDPLLRKPQLLHVCPNAVCFLEEAFKLKRPLLLDHYNLGKRRLVTMEENYAHIFLYPDKYIYKCDRTQGFFYFNFLQQSFMKPYSFDLLSKQPYCDLSYTGSDSLARGCAAASIEMQAKAIIVSSSIASMAKKIAHFRPLAPIVLVTRTKCLMEYVMLYHNVVKLLVPLQEGDSHTKLVYKEMIYALKFVQALKLLKTGDNVILVYGMHRGTKFPDKYLAYTFDEDSFVMQLKYNLFH